LQRGDAHIPITGERLEGELGRKRGTEKRREKKPSLSSNHFAEERKRLRKKGENSGGEGPRDGKKGSSFRTRHQGMGILLGGLKMGGGGRKNEKKLFPCKKRFKRKMRR